MNTFGMRMKCHRGLLFGLAFVMTMAFPAILLSQAYFGAVSGVMTDSTGAVIPGVKLTLTDVAKGYTFTATSNKAGEFLLPSLPPSTYNLAAEMNGFDKAERTGIIVEVTGHVTVNLSLKVAGATQTVQVSSQTTSLQTQDATTGQVINRRFIEDLPNTNRYVMDLVQLAPGVTNVDDTCGINCTGTNFISNGSRNATADVLMDGASITNMEPNGGITNVTYTPSVESVQEFKVQQSNFSAEYGFSGGSIVNMVTQSGTNTYHGSLYDFIRNQALDANDWFADHFGQGIPNLSRHNYGGTVGGPIFKNKTFFFFDWDGTYQVSQSVPSAGVPARPSAPATLARSAPSTAGPSTQPDSVLSLRGRYRDPYTNVFNPVLNGGVASAFIPFNNMAAYTSPGNPKLAGTPFQPSHIPGDLIDPVAQTLMNLFPMPNIQGGTIYRNWTSSGSGLSKENQFDVKIDQRFSQSNLMTGRWSQSWSNSVPQNCYGNFIDPCAGGPNQTPTHLFVVDDTETFNPTTVLDTTFRIHAWLGENLYLPASRRQKSACPIRSVLWASRNI